MCFKNIFAKERDNKMKEINYTKKREIDVFVDNILWLNGIVAKCHDNLMKGAFYNSQTKTVHKRHFLTEQTTVVLMLLLDDEGFHACMLTPDYTPSEVQVLRYLPIDEFDAIELKGEKELFFNLRKGNAYECTVHYVMENYKNNFKVTFEDGEEILLPGKDYCKDYVFLDPNTDRTVPKK